MAQAIHTSKNGQPLDLATIERVAPSVFATHKREDRSEKYAFIATKIVLDRLMSEGFRVYSAGQTIVKDAENRGFARHLLRLRHPSHIGLRATKDLAIPELVLRNSHDGTSAYQLDLGFWRQVCSNGMIAFRPTKEVRVRHSGNVIDDVIEGSFRVIEDAEETSQRIVEYSKIILPHQEQLALANAAATVRWGDARPIEVVKLNEAVRWEDKGDDLWKTFNRIQEHITKGGDQGRSAGGRRMKSRPINSVNEDTRINRALWQLADEMAKLKGLS